MTILQEREQRGVKEGIQQGRQEGVEEGLKTAAKSMIVEGESIDRIMKYTRLTKSEIEEIKKEMIN